jgi:hypothetical protein
MKQWLEERGCRDVVLEGTGVYWEPVFNVLSEEREEVKTLERVGAPRELSQEERQWQQEMAARAIRVTLANPQEVKNRRGDKTDEKDAWWLAHLFRHGMIRPSYVPERSVRERRMLTPPTAGEDPGCGPREEPPAKNTGAGQREAAGYPCSSHTRSQNRGS